MQNILITGNTPNSLAEKVSGLTKYETQFSVVTTVDPQKIGPMVQDHSIAMVLFDLQNADIEWVRAVLDTAQNYLNTTCIVMIDDILSPPPKDWLPSDLPHFVSKAMDTDKLASVILETLNLRDEGTIGKACSLLHFLYLIETTGISCLLEVTDPLQTKGIIYLNDGQLHDAVHQRARGAQAVYDMIHWKTPTLALRDAPSQKLKKNISGSLREVVDMQKPDPSQPHDSGSPQPRKLADIEAQIDVLFTDANNPQALSDSKGTKQMSNIKEKLEGFKTVDGFQAAGVFSAEGEMISDLNPGGLKIAELGALANDVLLKAQKTTEIMGVGRGNLVHVEAPKAHVIARCLNESTDFSASTVGRAHIHLVAIFERECNLAMGKMKLASIIEQLAEFFR